MESSYRVNIMHELQIKTKSLETIFTHVSLDRMVLCHCSLPHRSFRDLPGEMIPQKSLRVSMKESMCKKDTVAVEFKYNYVKRKRHSHRSSFLNLSLPKIIHYHTSSIGQPSLLRLMEAGELDG